MSEHNPNDMLVSFGIGLLVGAVGGVLLAPASGRETRDRLRTLSHDTLEKAREGAETVLEQARERVEGAKEFASDQAQRLERAVHEGKEAFRRESTTS